MVEDDVSIFNIQRAVRRQPHSFQGRNSTTHPGGGPLWCSGHPATPTNRGNEVSSSTSSLSSSTWSSLPEFRAKNSSWLVVRLHLAHSKAWSADYLESLSIWFSSTEYKPERFHSQPLLHPTSKPSRPSTYLRASVRRPREKKPTPTRSRPTRERSSV